jgi:hypothetical protein
MDATSISTVSNHDGQSWGLEWKSCSRCKRRLEGRTGRGGSVTRDVNCLCEK